MPLFLAAVPEFCFVLSKTYSLLAQFAALKYRKIYVIKPI